jgi:WD40 repeat protein
MSHIFISYSRRDLEFAGRIVQALAQNQLDTWIDWKSIPKGEDWEKEIYHGIEEADAFLFLISPFSVVSEMCNKEIAYAVKNNKRILPIFIADVEDAQVYQVASQLLHSVPRDEINRRNFVFCRQGRDDFDKAIEIIRTTIHMDYEWVKFHTKLQVRALEWQRGSDQSRLLRGRELREMEKLLAEAGPNKNPQPTDVQQQYLVHSRKHEEKTRRRLKVGLWSVGAVLLIVALAAIYYAIDSNHQARIAFIGDLVRNSKAESGSQPVKAILLAIEAANHARQESESLMPGIQEALYGALDSSSGHGIGGVNGEINHISFGGDKLLVGGLSGPLLVWKLVDGRPTASPISLPAGEQGFETAEISPDGRWLISGGYDGAIVVWDLTAPDPTKSPQVLGNAGMGVFDVAASQDGKFAAASGPENSVLLLDLSNPASPRLLDQLPGDQDYATKLAFSPNGKYLAVGDGMGKLTVWDIHSPSSIQQFFRVRPHHDFVTDLEFTADGKWLASGSWDGSAYLWDLEKKDPAGQPVTIVEYDDNAVTELEMSRDGKWIVVGAGRRIFAGEIQILDFSALLSGEVYEPFVISNPQVLTLEVSPDGRWLAANGDYGARLWDLDSISIQADPHDLEKYEQNISSLAFSPDGKWLAVGSFDGSGRLWQMANTNDAGHPITIVSGETVTAFDFAGSRGLVFGLENGEIEYWKNNGRNEEPGLIARVPNGGSISHIRVDPNLTWFSAVSNSDTSSEIYVWAIHGDGSTSGPVSVAQSDPFRFLSLKMSRDGKMLAFQGGGNVQVVDMTSDSLRAEEIPGTDYVTSFEFSGDSATLITLDINSRLQLWSLSEGMYVSQDEMKSPPSWSTLAVSPDGKWLAIEEIGDEKTRVRMISIRDGKFSSPPAGFDGHEIDSMMLLFSDDSRWLASSQMYSQNPADWDTDLLLWDLVNPRSPQQHILKGPETNSYVLEFSPDGDWLVSASGHDGFAQKTDNTVRIWDLREGSSYASIVLRGFDDGITQAEVSPDGKWLAVSTGKKIRLWMLDLDDLIQFSCRVTGRNFTQAEWEQYFRGEKYHATCPLWPAGE